MAYHKDLWKFANSVEYEYKYAGKYGAKGEKRRARKKATPEQVKRQNQYNREKAVRRLMKANFDKGDVWATVKYRAGTRKPVGEVKKDLRAFLSALRYPYVSTAGAFRKPQKVGREPGWRYRKSKCRYK